MHVKINLVDASGSEYIKPFIVVIAVVAVFAVRSTSAYSSPVGYDQYGCWSYRNLTHTFYSTPVQFSYVPAVNECLSICWMNSSCYGMDWDPTNSEGHYCWLTLGPNPLIADSPTITQYILNRTCLGCWSTPIVSANVEGGQLVPGISDVFNCQAACYNSLNCIGIDFDNSDNCWLTFSGELDATSGVTHFILDRNCNNGFPVPSPLSTRRTEMPTSTTPMTTPILSSTSTPNPSDSTTTSTTSTTTTTTTTAATTTKTSAPTTTTTTTTTTSSSAINQSVFSSEGTSFTLSFPPVAAINNRSAITVTICTTSVDDVTVNIASQDPNIPYQQTVIASLASCQVLDDIPLKFRPLLNSMQSSFLSLTATDIITVQTTLFGSCASYASVPDTSLGSVYSAVTLQPDVAVGDAAFIFVTAPTLKSTSVGVSFLLQTDENSNLSNVTWCDGRNFTVTSSSPPLLQTTVGPNTPVCLMSKFADLSGTIVRVPDNAQVAVYSGNTAVRGTTDSANYVVTQLWPTAAWSKNFVAITPATASNKYDLKIVGNSAATVVRINGDIQSPLSLSSSSAGSNYSNVFMRRNLISPVVIESNQPVTVVQYPVDVKAAILLPGTDSFRQQYSFVLPPIDNFGGDYLVMAWSDQVSSNSSLLMNQMKVATKWQQFSTYYNSAANNYWSTYITSVDPGSYVMTISPFGNVTFGAYVFRSNGLSCALGHPLSVGKRAPIAVKTMPRTPSLAIRPAYIVLAGVGGGILVLVAVAVVLLCYYPISNEDITNKQSSSAVSSEVTGSTLESRSSQKKPKKKKKTRQERQKELTQAYLQEGHVEMSENINNTNGSVNTAVVVPRVQSKGSSQNAVEDNPAYDHDVEMDGGTIYGNQKEIDRMTTLERDTTNEF